MNPAQSLKLRSVDQIHDQTFGRFVSVENNILVDGIEVATLIQHDQLTAVGADAAGSVASPASRAASLAPLANTGMNSDKSAQSIMKPNTPREPSCNL